MQNETDFVGDDMHALGLGMFVGLAIFMVGILILADNDVVKIGAFAFLVTCVVGSYLTLKRIWPDGVFKGMQNSFDAYRYRKSFRYQRSEPVWIHSILDFIFKHWIISTLIATVGLILMIGSSLVFAIWTRQYAKLTFPLFIIGLLLTALFFPIVSKLDKQE